ncbi:porin [Aquincola sp. MAHUQ-54]|uniref:Porin n=1 Tax=Aquincola agrisoli TaxID=3119538 RepID=A0AAW9QPU8_9BURK
MQPKFAALAAACLGASSAVMAQGTVNVSGVLDLAVRQVRNEGVGSMASMVSGSNATSRIIVSGREDLGGGWNAGFHLEHGLLADSGTQVSSTKFWDRRSTISLSHAQRGELRLGRDLVPSYVSWSRYDPFSYIGAARSANLVSATPLGPVRSAFGTSNNTTVRSDNAVQFLLPSTLGGFEGGLMLAASEGGVVTSGSAKLVGLRLGYAAKAFNVSAARTTSENNQSAAVGKFRDTTFGGAAEGFGIKWSAAWREFKVDTAKQVLLLLGAHWTMGPHEVKVSWVRSDASGRVGATSTRADDARQIGIGYVHHLSKRTALYATAAQLSNGGAARFVISDGPAGMAGGGTSRGYELGLRHRF